MSDFSQSRGRGTLGEVARLGAKVSKVLVRRARDFAKEAQQQVSETVSATIREVEEELKDSEKPSEEPSDGKGK